MANTRRKPNGRLAEQRYANRTRDLLVKIKKPKTQGADSSAPWKTFFAQGEGATLQTGIPKTSIQSIVYMYGKKMGKRFKCSYSTLESGETIVVIENVKRRERQ